MYAHRYIRNITEKIQDTEFGDDFLDGIKDTGQQKTASK